MLFRNVEVETALRGHYQKGNDCQSPAESISIGFNLDPGKDDQTGDENFIGECVDEGRFEVIYVVGRLYYLPDADCEDDQKLDEEG
jgi:hypothetical protein